MYVMSVVRAWNCLAVDDQLTAAADGSVSLLTPGCDTDTDVMTFVQTLIISSMLNYVLCTPQPSSDAHFDCIEFQIKLL